jgi:pimeloyl-ACP methyl ester carboxylesterase
MRPATERHGYASSDGVRIHYVEQGPDNGRVVLMMHGFP